ncbi:MAG TPA: PspC domain-containing protein [Candidatus Limnocylindria bacterium]
MENVSPTPTSAPPRLYRSTTDKVIGGVCGGLAAYFRIDPVIVRLAFVVFTLAGGASFLLYIVLWIAVPVGDTVPMAETTTFFGMRGSETTALVLIAIGALWLLANIGVFRFINWSVVWPLVLVAFGAAMLLRGARR